ncbi:TraB/GumN family protein [Vibrio agarivorans]|uniref:TraB/GumN family protein n=1 Tax=Vibrio agarivorans TaxID=153622 RepID=A0ABT7XXM7_9VIBR|nr:TraB/GumN family protein [Vibrio agarivorans]MDN2480531.1 TraB/GumN family protein [Vibrio agarivorans]
MSYSKLLSPLLLLLSYVAQAEPLSWFAEKEGLSYTLVGSVHVGDNSMYPMPDKLIQRLQAADGLIVEANTLEAKQLRYPSANTTVKEQLNDSQLERLGRIARMSGMQIEDVQSFPPWMAAMSLQMSQLQRLGYTPDKGVDLHFMQQATSQQTPIYGLESLQFQIDLIAKQPDDGLEMLTAFMEEFNQTQQLTRCLIDTWNAGDESNLEAFAHISEMSPELEKAFIDDRNQAWAEILNQKQPLEGQDSTIEDGNYFVVVGSLHLVGEGNVRELLEARGFEVTQISNSSAAGCEFGEE